MALADKQGLLGSVLAFVVWVGVLAWAAHLRSMLFLIAAGAMLFGTIVGFREQLDAQVLRERRWAAATLLVVGTAVIAGWAFTEPVTDLWGFIGVALAGFGYGGLMRQWRTYCATDAGRKRSLVISMVLVAVALGSLIVGIAAGLMPLPLILGAVTFAVGVPILSELVILGLTDRRAVRLTIIGALALGVATAIVGLGGASLFGVAYFAGLVLLLVYVLVADSELDVDAAVIVVGLIYALTPRVAGAEPPGPPSGDTLVVMGDSYIAGEGAREFYDKTSVKGVNECRRSPTAYGPELVDEELVDLSLAFVACSGAKARDVSKTLDVRYETDLDGEVARDVVEGRPRPQYPGEPVGGTATCQVGPDSSQREPCGLYQLDHLRQALQVDPAKVELVVVSIGGNDAGFGDIVQACVAPGDCAEIGQRFLDFIVGLDTRLAEVYDEIKSAFPGVDVVAVSYPMPMTSDGCSWSALGKNEHMFISGFAVELNRAIAHAAGKAGIFHLAEMEDALKKDTTRGLEGVRICEDGIGPGEAGMNFLAANPVEGIWFQRLNPLNWLHNSMHPNAIGHDRLKNTFHDWYVGPKVVAPDLGDFTPRSLDTIMRKAIEEDGFTHCGYPNSPPDHCELETSEWIKKQSANQVIVLSFPLGLGFLGAWLFSVGATAWRRQRAAT